MNPVASLHRRPARVNHPGNASHARAPGDARADRARDSHERLYGKPTLSTREYVDELNERLRRHPMFLEGMHFPEPQPGSTPMLAAALAWEGSWDCMGVFTSVAQDVARDYDLAPGGRHA